MVIVWSFKQVLKFASREVQFSVVILHVFCVLQKSVQIYLYEKQEFSSLCQKGFITTLVLRTNERFFFSKLCLLSGDPVALQLLKK